MTASDDRRIAGQRADATVVAGLLRDRYTNPAKDAIRSWIVQELVAVEPLLVLDLWGGGRSAEEMTAAGLSVLSVDRAASIDPPITAMRVKRALKFRGEAGGYRTAWGPVARYAHECDAAWLDFMGHLCGETVRTLQACRGMKAVAITLMPDRMAGVTNLPIETWSLMYRVVIEHYTGLRVRHAPRKYRRKGGQWVLVFFARGTASPMRERGHETPEAKARKKALAKARRADPENKERLRAYSRAWREAHPDYREIVRARLRERYRNDPEYREHQKAVSRAYKSRPEVKERERVRRAARPQRQAWRVEYDKRPDVVERRNARNRERYATDPVYRERAKAYHRDPENRERKNELRRAHYAARKAAGLPGHGPAIPVES